MSTQVCTVDDAYVRDRMRWVVVLSNGETVYEDDGRPGLEEPSAWKRLKTYCCEKKIYIVEMWLQFRSNRVMVEPRNADGYFLTKSAFGVWGNKETFHAYVAGVLVDGFVKTVKWKIPELVALENQVREADPDSPMLISKIT